MALPVSKLEMERRKRFLSQWDLARATGIVQSRLSLIERGEAKATKREIEAISKALGVQVEQVVSFLQDRPYVEEI